MFRRLASSLGIGLLVALAIAAGAALWGYGEYRKAGPASAPVTLVLERGAGVDRIAERLAEAGVIDNPDLFVVAARLLGGGRDLKAGEYRFAAGASIAQVLRRLRAGATVVRRLTVPEGLSSRQVLALLAGAEGLSGPVGEPPPEGALLPETYHYSYGDSRLELVERMRRAMRRALDELWPTRQPDLPLASPEEAVVLASIVEKETAVAAERPRIAGVFVNRLERGMPLQSDPTVAFALTEGRGELDRPLLRADLGVDSPYNTYRVKGLPPGPIGNPGRAALLAALQPAATDELYFVADGTGGHAFARTYAGHRENVRRWRRLQAGEKPQ